MVFRFLKMIAFGFLLVFFLWSAGAITYIVSTQYVEPLYPSQKTDAIVILTGDNYRIEDGLDLWSQLLAPELFISGVNEKTNRTDILSAWKGERRLPLCCLTLDFESKTTRQNAIQTARWIEKNYIRSIRLVTSDYHMPRAVLEFKAVMPDLEIIEHPVRHKLNKQYNKSWLRLLVIEYSKNILRRLEIMTGRDWIKRSLK